MISDRLKVLSESATLAMAVKARELQAKGHHVIKLNLGEPDFQTPDHIKTAAKQAIDDGFTFYPPVAGIPDLKEAICAKLKRDNQLEYSPANIVVSGGAKQSIANVLLSIINKGDEVIIFTPYWVTYVEQVKLAEGTPVILKGGIENDFKVTAEELKAAITPNTKAILFSSPCNPTGSVFTKKDLEEIAEVVKAHENITVISDEIYEYINFDSEHYSIAQVPGMIDRTVVVNGFSKGFAMTGWRLGYIAAPVWIANACNKIQGQITSGTSSISQKAGVAALNGGLEPSKKMTEAYLRRRNLVKGKLDEIEGFKTNLPQGAFYIFPEISYFFGKTDGETTIENSYDFSMFILNEAHVSIVDGTAFGDPDCVRISFAASDEELTEAISRIKKAVAKLK
ncbi:pyridoxal phosphate-dependent aminotransferase [Chondrinema litorale]|uniref:pyridoxal phosphate-dependent aminotransferase n=1 Tax=Chondrinema litorale TaxID=2994555 RepID=UPI002542CD70|nr:pyridoxal phosphate-dependent aminotransferase [Chondrinema litorale]UZR93802.1 pyridoxal phosphate-dependent aminotransferase [Chondrinema litorale]